MNTKNIKWPHSMGGRRKEGACKGGREEREREEGMEVDSMHVFGVLLTNESIGSVPHGMGWNIITKNKCLPSEILAHTRPKLFYVRMGPLLAGVKVSVSLSIRWF